MDISIYINIVWWGDLNIRSIACWNMDGAVLRPKGKTFRWRCRFGRQNAVLYFSSGWISSCQNPNLRSNFKNIVAPWRRWRSALLFGSRNLVSRAKKKFEQKKMSRVTLALWFSHGYIQCSQTHLWKRTQIKELDFGGNNKLLSSK